MIDHTKHGVFWIYILGLTLIGLAMMFLGCVPRSYYKMECLEVAPLVDRCEGPENICYIGPDDAMQCKWKSTDRQDRIRNVPYQLAPEGGSREGCVMHTTKHGAQDGRNSAKSER